MLLDSTAGAIAAFFLPVDTANVRLANTLEDAELVYRHHGRATNSLLHTNHQTASPPLAAV